MVCTAVMALVDIAFVYQGVINGASYLVDENNVLENAQAIILFLSMLVLSYALVNAEKGNRGVLFAGALACLTFFLREVDVKDFDLPQAIIFVGSGSGRNATLGALWLLVFVGIFRRFSYYKEVFSRLLFSTPCFLFCVGGALLLIGKFFEENMLGLSSYKFYEELAEMNAYCFILMAAVATPETLHGQSAHPRFSSGRSSPIK
jgi:hypothetical protein